MSNFPRFDRVIRRQRSMMFLGRFVTTAFFVGVVGVTSTLAGCAAESDEEARNRTVVEDHWAAAARPAGDPLGALRAEVLAFMPDAVFEVEDAYGEGGAEVTAHLLARGTLIRDYMGLRADGLPTTLRFAVITLHDRAGRILEARRVDDE